MAKKVFIVSGEESGDKHGSALMESLKGLDSSISFVGMGGDRMRKSGLSGLDASRVSVVGISEALKKLPGIMGVLKELKKLFLKEKPDCVVLIDLPDFNLRFASFVKKHGVPVVYYISPQVWAWRESRIKKIAALVDKMLVVFPFEKEIYEREGVDVEFVGHPLTDMVKIDKTRNEAKAELGYNRQDCVVTLLPGSREEEVEKMLPLMIESMEVLKHESRWRMKYIVVCAGNISEEQIERHIEGADLHIRVMKGNMYTALRASLAAVVTSGTATLEAALVGTPHLVIYKLAASSYLLGKMLIGIKHIGLPNIIAGEEVVPELIQGAANPKKICQETLHLLEDSVYMDRAARGFAKIRESLGTGGASLKAAQAVKKTLDAS